MGPGDHGGLIRTPHHRRRSPVPRALATALLAATAGATAGCGPDAPAGIEGPWEARVDTVADTVVVRTVSGSVWGDSMTLVPEVEIGVLDGPPEYIFGNIQALEVDGAGRIWVVDGQIPEVRVFAPDGAFLRTVGHPGEGPGELKGPDGGLRILSDGRVLVRDPGNSRIQVYGPDGEALDTWPLRANFSTSAPMYRDRRDNVYTQVLLDPEFDVSDWRLGLVRIGPDGVSGDTLTVPDAGWEPATVEARAEGSWSRNTVPFSPLEAWALHPDGWFVHGLSTDYAFTLLRKGQDPALRVERAWTPVPVAPGEAEEARRAMVANMRRLVSDWSWNGPEIPAEKPAFGAILVGADGRIWLSVPTPAHRVDVPEPDDPDEVPDRWREDVAFDVFEADGRFLGPVRTPPGFGLHPTPRFDGDQAWAVTRDELGVQRVVRYRRVPLDEARGSHASTGGARP